MSGTKHHHFKVLPLAIALGIVWGLGMLVVGWFNWWTGTWGNEFVKVMASVYVGYSASFWGGVIGFIWGFVDMFVAGLIICWIYNCCSGCCKKCD